MLIDNLLQTDKPLYDPGFNNTDLLIAGQVNTKIPTAQSSKYEVNIYSFNGILLESYIQNNPVPFRKTSTGKYLDINLSTYFDQSNLNSGKYYYIVNSYGTVMDRLVVEEISSTRTEIRLLKSREKSFNAIELPTEIPIAGFVTTQTVEETNTTQTAPNVIPTDFDNYLIYKNTNPRLSQFKNIFLNFGQNRLYRVINIENFGAPTYEILIKLLIIKI